MFSKPKMSKANALSLKFNSIILLSFYKKTCSFLFYSRLFSAKVAAQYAILEDNTMDQYNESLESEADKIQQSLPQVNTIAPQKFHPLHQAPIHQLTKKMLKMTPTKTLSLLLLDYIVFVER